MAVRGVGNNYFQPMKKYDKTDSKAKDIKKIVSHVAARNEGVSYEKTIPDSVSAGLEFIKNMETQVSGTKFLIGAADSGQNYGNSQDVNFVINPKFLDKLGTDEALRKQFEEDVEFLNEFTKRFKTQPLFREREIVSQCWFCDEAGNWGGMLVNKLKNRNPALQDVVDNTEEIRHERLEGLKKVEQELKEYFGNRFKEFSVDWSEEDKKPEGVTVSEGTEETPKDEGNNESIRVGANAAKLARKIAAAKTRGQLQGVIAEIKSDLQEVEEGFKKGWCDRSEVDKVKALLTMAQNKMGSVEDREATPEEKNMFAMASLM